MEEFALTTIDNPYSPWDQFDEWYSFDVSHGYNTCAYLARIAKTSDSLSAADYTLAVNLAIEEILRLNLTGKYKRVTEKDYKKQATA